MPSTDAYIDGDADIVHHDHRPLDAIDITLHSVEHDQLPKASAHFGQPEDDPGLCVLGFGTPSMDIGLRSLSKDGSEVEDEDMSQPVATNIPNDAALHPTDQILKPDAASTTQLVTSDSKSRDLLQNTAALAIQQSETNSHSPGDNIELASRPAHRVDSAQESLESVPHFSKHDGSPSNRNTSPLVLRTSMQPPAPGDAQDSIAQSPTLRKHVIQVGDTSAHTLPAVQSTSATTETTGNNPRKESLPSFRQLADLADIASQQPTTTEGRPAMPARQHSHSIR